MGGVAVRIEQVTDVQVLKPILAYRQSHSAAAEFGMATSMEEGLHDLAFMLEHLPGAIFVCYDGVELVGCLVVNAVKNFFGPQQVAIVKYWYAMPNKVRAGPVLLKAAFLWAKQNECSHLLSAASHFFTEPHPDKVARFYEQLGMKLLERVYLGEV
jgi:hypothetical protein